MNKLNEKDAFASWKKLDDAVGTDNRKKIMSLSTDIAEKLKYDGLLVADLCLELLQDVNVKGVNAKIADILLKKFEEDGTIINLKNFIGKEVRLGNKRLQSTWNKRMRKGTKAIVLSVDHMSDTKEEVAIIALKDDYVKPDFDPEMDYQVVYQDELVFE